MAQSTPTPQWPCNDCGTPLMHPIRWPIGNDHWQPLCWTCYQRRDLDLDKQNAVKLASVICAIWWAILDGAERPVQP